MDYVRTYPHLSGPRLSQSVAHAGTCFWEATAGSPWPAGTPVMVSIVIPWGRYPELDPLRREELRLRAEFKRLAGKASSNSIYPVSVIR